MCCSMLLPESPHTFPQVFLKSHMPLLFQTTLSLFTRFSLYEGCACYLFFYYLDVTLTLFGSVTLKGRDPTEAESVVPEVQTAEVVAEERKIIEAAPRHLQEVPPQPVTDREDDWFVLLNAVPRGSSYVPPGILKISPALPHYFYQSQGFILNFADTPVPSTVTEDFTTCSHSCCATTRVFRRTCLSGRKCNH